jgi:hypothetical protein
MLEQLPVRAGQYCSPCVTDLHTFREYHLSWRRSREKQMAIGQSSGKNQFFAADLRDEH